MFSLHLHRGVLRRACPFVQRSLALVSAAWLLATTVFAIAPTPKLTFSARVGFDSNVYLQDLPPSPTVAGAVAPRHESIVSSASLLAAVDFAPGKNTRSSASYGLERVSFASAHAEDHQVHRFGVKLTHRAGANTVNWQQTLTSIHGADRGPIFGAQGGAAVMGGIALRDRRDALFTRGVLTLLHDDGGAWSWRAAASVYVHDFQTEQRRDTGYLNYLDREEWTAGVDALRTLQPKLKLVSGVRVGRQDQRKLHGVDSAWDSRLQRIHVGLEGTLAPWIDCQLLAGPEHRDYLTPTPAGFDRDRVFWWIDATLTARPSTADVVVLCAKRFTQPAFGSASLYEDITYSVSWKRRVAAKTHVSAGYRAYGGSWPSPGLRRDWVHTLNLQLQHEFSPSWRAELNALSDRALSRIPQTAGRAFRRQFIELAFTYNR